MSRDAPDGDVNRWGRSVDRRSVLLALGAGSSAALTSPYGAASVQEGDGAGQDGDTGGQGSRQCPPCIDSYSGYLQVEAMRDEQPLGNIDPGTTVELRVADADVAFPDDAGAEATEPGPATNETVNETVETVVPGTEGANETLTGEPEAGNETTPGAPGPENETAGVETEPGADAGATDGESQGIPDFYFDPVGVHLQPGDTVEFLGREELHTVTAFHPRFGFQQRVPDEAPGFTSPPFLAGDSWYYRFDEPGVYDMLCLPHLGLGMVMRAVVADEESDEVPEAAPLPGPDEPELALPEIVQNVLSAPELEPQTIVDEGAVAWTDLSDIAGGPPPGV